MIQPLIKPESEEQRVAMSAFGAAFDYKISLEWAWTLQDVENMAFVASVRGRADIAQQLREAFDI